MVVIKEDVDELAMRVPPLNLQGTGGGGAGGGGMDRLPLPLSFSPDMLWRYPVPFSPAALPSSPAPYDFKTQMPTSLGTDPRVWAREDVCSFLQWCEREFELPQIEMDRFRMNGKALIMLNKADLSERAPGAGDIVHNALQMLLRDASVRLPASPLTPHSLSTSASASPSWSTLTAGDNNTHSFPSLMPASTSVTLSPASSLDSQCASPKRSDHKQLLCPGGPLSTGSSKQTTPSDSEDSRDSESPQRSPVNAPLSPSYQAALHSAWAKQQQQQQHHHHQQLQQQQQKPVLVQMQVPAAQQQQQQVQQLQSDPGPPPPSPSDTSESGSGGRLLWDFLQQLLNDPMQRFTELIEWKNAKTGVFKITDPPGLARLWGIQKNHLSMNYDKMSRALRYYYRVNILRKVQGERHCYQFLRNPTELKSMKSISMLRGAPSKPGPRSPSSPHSTVRQAPMLHQMERPQAGNEALHGLPQGTEVIHVEPKSYDLSAVSSSVPQSSMEHDEGPTDLSMPQDLTTDRRAAGVPEVAHKARDVIAMETEQILVPPLMQIKVEQEKSPLRMKVEQDESAS